MAEPITNIEQYTIDTRIAAARLAYNLSEGETILQVIQGGISEDWQETYAQIAQEPHVVHSKPNALPTDDDPGPIEAT